MSFQLPLHVGIMAGVATVTVKYLMDRKDLFRKLRRWMRIRKSKSHTWVRWKRKKVALHTSVYRLNKTQRIDDSFQDYVDVEELYENEKTTYQVPQHPAFEDSYENKTDDARDLQQLLRYCRENKPVTFAQAVPVWKQVAASQYGTRAMNFLSFDPNGSRRVFNCFPVKSSTRRQSTSACVTIREVTLEAVCSLYLGNLLDGPIYVAPNFPITYSIYYVEDKFPALGANGFTVDKLTIEHEKKETYRREEAFVTIERAYCGIPLAEKKDIGTWMAVSIVSQVAAALAVAEEALEFEHRDLHIGNIFIKHAKTQFLKYSIGKLNFAIESCGIRTCVSEFNSSRITAGGKVFYRDFESSLQGIGAEIERREQGNPWLEREKVHGIVSSNFRSRPSEFNPKTNVMWLKHLIENILLILRKDLQYSEASFTNASSGMHQNGQRLLESWSRVVLESASASTFLRNVVFLSCPLVLLLAAA